LQWSPSSKGWSRDENPEEHSTKIAKPAIQGWWWAVVDVDWKANSLTQEFWTNKKVTEFSASFTTPAAFP